MRDRLPLILIATLMLAVAIGAYVYTSRHPREIIAVTTLTIERRTQTPQSQTLRVRTVRIAATTFQEVELPNGTWIDCAGDCKAAATTALDRFWEDQDTRRK